LAPALDRTPPETLSSIAGFSKREQAFKNAGGTDFDSFDFYHSSRTQISPPLSRIGVSQHTVSNTFLLFSDLQDF
jgi:hypothetical protein